MDFWWANKYVQTDIGFVWRLNGPYSLVWHEKTTAG